VDVDTLAIGRPKPEKLTEVPPLPPKEEGTEGQQVEYLDKLELSLQTVIAECNRVGSNFELFHMELENSGEGERKHREALAHTIAKLQDGVGEVNTRVQLLAAKMGDAPFGSEKETQSLWEAVSQLEASTGRIQQEMERVRREGPEERNKHADNPG
jgi:hypothetical protein